MMEKFDGKLLEGNDRIEEAIHLFHTAQTPETWMAVCMAIRSRMDENGQLLFPADFMEDEQGNTLIDFKTLEADGVPAAVAFTSLVEKRKGPPCGGVTHYFDSVMKPLLQIEHLGGLWINPWGESVYLGKEDIGLILTPGVERFV